MTKFRFGKYRETDSMSRLLCENYSTLLVLSRFGIALGFGDKNIGEVCQDNNVDTDTFLTVINLLLSDNQTVQYTETHFSIESLIAYLHNSHTYFLDYRLPEIRVKLVEVLDPKEKDLNKAVLHYFDEYVSQVNKHMKYEEKTVFPYVYSLLAEEKKENYHIGIFSKRHEQIEIKLTEFKHILIKYYPAKSSNEINRVLFDIFNCEKDLTSHSAIEDCLLIPAIMELENKNRQTHEY
ncbi:MAG: hemerythrin domain-containing protein [Dysgonamonadaceae bacterium]|jgi:regulator of cell morphogenesis and NO signaling|nr:hemerythrin domain-containing protein [Dysgonamonadaceae bacterium]